MSQATSPLTLGRSTQGGAVRETGPGPLEDVPQRKPLVCGYCSELVTAGHPCRSPEEARDVCGRYTE